jgi:hypothetical protein
LPRDRHELRDRLRFRRIRSTPWNQKRADNVERERNG